jgi:hypothetical protein
MGNGDLVAIHEFNNSILTLTPEPFSMGPAWALLDENATAIESDGGDLVHAGDNDWLVWTNMPGVLFRIDHTTGTGPRIGTPSAQFQYIVGLTYVGGQLYGLSRDGNAIHRIDDQTSQITSSLPLCVSCPAPFDLDFGDIAAVPSGM